MKEKNKHKAVLGTIVATGLAASVACSSPTPAGDSAAKSSASEQSERVSAADKIVIDGQEVDTSKILADTVRPIREVKPMYGPPKKKLKPEKPVVTNPEERGPVVYGSPPVIGNDRIKRDPLPPEKDPGRKDPRRKDYER